MASVIGKSSGDGMAINRVGTSFAKNSTFDKNFDYVIVQNGKIVGATGGYRVSAERATLNKKCFPELKTPFLGAVKADVYAMKRFIQLTPRIDHIDIKGEFPKGVGLYSRTEVIAHFRVSLSVSDAPTVYRKLIEMPGGTSYPEAALKGVFRDIATDAIDKMIKNMTTRPSKIVINTFTNDGSTDAKFFEDFKKVMAENFKLLGYTISIVKC